jgi:hypothetical protein
MQEVVLSQFKHTPNANFGRDKHYDFGWRTQPLVNAFCYTPEGNFVVKGMEAEVAAYIAKTYKLALVHTKIIGPREQFPTWSILKDGVEVARGYRTIKAKQPKESKVKGYVGRKRYTSSFSNAWEDDYYQQEEERRTKKVFSFSTVWRHGKEIKTLELRRLPKKWIPQYEELIKDY